MRSAARNLRAWTAWFLAARRRLRSASGVVPWVTGFTPASPRADYTGWVGMRFLVGAAALRVTALGRLMLVGNAQTHTVKLLTAGGAAEVADGSASVALTVSPVGDFCYANLGAPVTLAANTEYWLLSSETAGGDAWWDSVAAGSGVVIATTDAASALGLAWGTGPGSWGSNSLPNKCFGPVGLRYSLVVT